MAVAAALELATVVVLFFIIFLFLVLWCCCCPLNKVEVELEAAPYSEEVGDTLAEELETGDEQPFTGTSLADDDEPNFDTKRPFSPLIIVVNSSSMD